MRCATTRERHPALRYKIRAPIGVVLVVACSLRLGTFGGQAPEVAEKDPAAVAGKIRKALATAKVEEYLLLLRDCIVQAEALGGPPEKNPFHQVLVGSLEAARPTALRVAVVRAITTPVAGSKLYLPGLQLLVQYLGREPPAFRNALREGLLLVMLQAPPWFVKQLKELLLGLDSSRSAVEDAAFLLWAHEPAEAVEALLEGLQARQKARKDVAPYHWLLSEFLRHREGDAAGWLRYWKESRTGLPVNETHFTRKRVEQELGALWDATAPALRSYALNGKGLSEVWALVKKNLDSPWRSLRVRACREIGLLTEKLSVGSPTPAAKTILKQMLQALIELLGAGESPRYEPLEVRLEALWQLRFFRGIVGAESRLAEFFSQALLSPYSEKAFQAGIIRTVAELELDGVRRALCEVVLQGAEQAPGGLDVTVEAVKALGKIGTEEPGNPDPDLHSKVVTAIENLYDQVEEAGTTQAEQLRKAAISALGKIGRNATGPQVRKFLRGVLQRSLKKKGSASLAVYATYALGELGDVSTLDVLSSILAERGAYPAALVQAAVDAVWLIGSSGKREASPPALEALAPYLSSGDKELSERVLQKVLNLCRESMPLVAHLAEKLRKLQHWDAVCSVLTHPDIRKIRQVALVEGSPEDFARFWAVEKALLEGYERRERFTECVKEIRALTTLLGELRRGEAFEAITKAQQEALADRLRRVEAKQQFLRALNERDAAAVLAACKKAAQAAGGFPWYAEKLKKSPLAEEVVPQLLKDPALPAQAKAHLAEPKKAERTGNK